MSIERTDLNLGARQHELLRPGSPGILPDGQRITVRVVNGDQCWGATGGLYPGRMDGSEPDQVALDLEDPTGLLHASWWLGRAVFGDDVLAHEISLEWDESGLAIREASTGGMACWDDTLIQALGDLSPFVHAHVAPALRLVCLHEAARLDEEDPKP